MDTSFSVPQQGRVTFNWIGESWQIYRRQPAEWCIALFIYIILGIALNFVLQTVLGVHNIRVSPGQGPTYVTNYPILGTGVYNLSLPNDIINLIDLFFSSFMMAGLYRMANRQLRGQTIGVSDLFGGGPVFVSMLAFNIVFSILLGIGLLLCILPGFVVAGVLYPGFALVADQQDLGTALSRSLSAMKSNWLGAGLFVIVWGVLVVLSAIPCGIGLLVTMPMSYLIASLMYRDIVGMPGVAQVWSVADLHAPSYPSAPGAWPPAPQAPEQQAAASSLGGSSDQPRAGEEPPNPPPATEDGHEGAKEG